MAGQWSRLLLVTRTWPGKLPPTPGWWWWREGTRLTSNWKGGIWWEAGSTLPSLVFWCSPCRVGMVLNEDSFGASDINKETKQETILNCFDASYVSDTLVNYLYSILLNVISIFIAIIWLTVYCLTTVICWLCLLQVCRRFVIFL